MGALAGGAALAATVRTTRAADGTTHKVVMKATAYSPISLKVKVGDRIVWVNEDPFPHTATAQGVFDSGSIAAGESWTYVAKQRGTHAYVCLFHPNMKGTLEVD